MGWVLSVGCWVDGSGGACSSRGRVLGGVFGWVGLSWTGLGVALRFEGLLRTCLEAPFPSSGLVGLGVGCCV